jgi:hypothetical protein
MKTAEAITGGISHLKPPKEDDSPFL